MFHPRDIIVSTTSSFEGIPIKQYLKPVSSHIVSGTNLFSDFFAALSDVFGGRSGTYQRQLTSLVEEATEQVKFSAFALGANAIVGFKLDLEEISGKNKSMLMASAMGTAVIIDRQAKEVSELRPHKPENISIDQIRLLRKKKEIIQSAQNDTLDIDDSVWNFITENKIGELFDYILIKLERKMESFKANPEELNPIISSIETYLHALPMDLKLDLLYKSISEKEDQGLVKHLLGLVKSLHLVDFNRVQKLLQATDFGKRKRALAILSFDKEYYNVNDIAQYKTFVVTTKSAFPEIGTRSSKKGFLSSKEKEVWICTCKNTIEMDKICGQCKTDIYGFRSDETSPPKAIASMEEKIGLLKEVF